METIISFLTGIDFFKIVNWIWNHTDLGLLTIIVLILILILKDRLSAKLQGKKYEGILNKGLDLLSERMKDNVKEKQANDEEKAKIEAAWEELKNGGKLKDESKTEPETSEGEVKEEVKEEEVSPKE